MWRPEAEYLGCSCPQAVLSHASLFFPTPQEAGNFYPFHTFIREAQRPLTCQQISQELELDTCSDMTPLMRKKELVRNKTVVAVIRKMSASQRGNEHLRESQGGWLQEDQLKLEGSGEDTTPGCGEVAQAGWKPDLPTPSVLFQEGPEDELHLLVCG